MILSIAIIVAAILIAALTLFVKNARAPSEEPHLAPKRTVPFIDRAVRFRPDGDGYVRINGAQLDTNSKCNVSFDILFGDDNDCFVMSIGTVKSTNEKPFLLISVTKGVLQTLYVRYRDGKYDVKSFASEPKELFDEKWHYIEYHYDSDGIYLAIDGVKRRYAISSDKPNLNDDVAIGKNDRVTLAPYSKYKGLNGCLDNLKINDATYVARTFGSLTWCRKTTEKINASKLRFDNDAYLTVPPGTFYFDLEYSVEFDIKLISTTGYILSVGNEAPSLMLSVVNSNVILIHRRKNTGVVFYMWLGWIKTNDWTSFKLVRDGLDWTMKTSDGATSTAKGYADPVGSQTMHVGNAPDLRANWDVAPLRFCLRNFRVNGKQLPYESVQYTGTVSEACD